MQRKQLSSKLAIVLFIISVGYSPALFSQVKIGNNPKSLNPDAVLEIESTNKGLILPRVALVSTKNSAPLRNFIQGMVVYNTSTVNDISPGLYYSDGTKWIRAISTLPPSDSNANQNVLWSLKGNGSVSSNNFLGSTNNAPLILKTNNAERFRITEKGWVGIGTSSPKAALQVKGQLIIDSLEMGNTATDKVLVANASDGRVKIVPASNFLMGVQNYNETVAANGQTIFKTPGVITDVSKILLYRNGVLISFTINNKNSIISEIPCKQGDQIRIIQLL